MSLGLKTVLHAEEELPKVISPVAHGLLDYCHAAFFLGMGMIYRKRHRRAAAAALLTGGFLLAESLLTDYPTGAARKISFPQHGRLDRAVAGAFIVLPRIFGFRNTVAETIFKTSSVLMGAVAGMTDWDDTQNPSGAVDDAHEPA
jgi:hypothetical protein